VRHDDEGARKTKGEIDTYPLKHFSFTNGRKYQGKKRYEHEERTRLNLWKERRHVVPGGDSLDH